MKNLWRSIGLKPVYETGELIVIKDNPKLFLLKKSPIALSRYGTEDSIRIEPKTSAGEIPFLEFYAIDSGTYTLSAQWGTANFKVVPRQNLGFLTEFGIFSTVVLILVLIMARRFLGLSKKQNRKPTT